MIAAGPPPPGRTGKLNAMAIGARRARGELIAFSDSDTRLDRDVLRLLVETLLTHPAAGDAFAPALVATPARTAGDVGYALLENAWYGASVALAAGESRELPFIMGQLMVFRREALAAIGGVECADGQLVDDMYIGRRVAAAGFRNVMARHPIHIVNEGLGLRDFERVFRRWLLFSRNGLPLRFTLPSWLRGIEFFAALAAAALALATGHLAGAIAPSLALLASAASPVALHRAFGGAPIAPRHGWVPLALPLSAPLLVLSTLISPHVDWRGRDYTLDAEAHLRPATPAQP